MKERLILKRIVALLIGLLFLAGCAKPESPSVPQEEFDKVATERDALRQELTELQAEPPKAEPADSPAPAYFEATEPNPNIPNAKEYIDVDGESKYAVGDLVHVSGVVRDVTFEGQNGYTLVSTPDGLWMYEGPPQQMIYQTGQTLALYGQYNGLGEDGNKYVNPFFIAVVGYTNTIVSIEGFPMEWFIIEPTEAERDEFYDGFPEPRTAQSKRATDKASNNSPNNAPDFFNDTARYEDFVRLLEAYDFKAIKEMVDAYIAKENPSLSDSAYMLPEMIKPITEALKKCNIHHDEVEGFTVVTYKGVEYLGRNINIIAELRGEIELVFVGFQASDWLFFDGYIIKTDADTIEESFVSDDMNREAEGGVVYEHVNTSLSYDEYDSITNSKGKVIIRFTSSDKGKSRDHTLSKKEIDALRTLTFINRQYNELRDLGYSRRPEK